MDLVRDLQKIPLSDRTTKWLKKARTGQVAVNPYWPRGHSAICAAYFCTDTDFNLGGFMDFVDSTGVVDPIGHDDFINWIGDLPQVLAELSKVTTKFWEQYQILVNMAAPKWLPMLEQGRKAAADFWDESAPKLIFAPNLLFSSYCADFVNLDSKIVVIVFAPDAESVLHEALHVTVAEHRGQITDFAQTHRLGNFADPAKMLELGYMSDNSIASQVHAIEECFVRALSVALAEGGAARFASHAKDGFTGVSRIGSDFLQKRPKAHNLGEFIHHILKEEKHVSCNG